MPTLIKFQTLWSDECHWEEYRILSQPLEDIQKEIDLLIKYWEYVGENEIWEAGKLTNDDFNITTISHTEAFTLTHLLGDRFGRGILSNLFDEDVWWKWDDKDEEYDQESMGHYEGWNDDN